MVRQRAAEPGDGGQQPVLGGPVEPVDEHRQDRPYDGHAAPSATLSLTVTMPILSIAKSHSGNFILGQANATYTVTVSNSGATSTSGTVTVTENVPSGLTLV